MGATWTEIQGGKNWILPKEINANRFFWHFNWLEIWNPSMALKGGSVAMGSESDVDSDVLLVRVLYCTEAVLYMYQVDIYIYMIFRPLFCTVRIVELLETLSKWNITVQLLQRFVTPIRLKYLSFCDIS